MSNFQPVAAEFNQDGTLVKIWGPNSQVAFDPSSVAITGGVIGGVAVSSGAASSIINGALIDSAAYRNLIGAARGGVVTPVLVIGDSIGFGFGSGATSTGHRMNGFGPQLARALNGVGIRAQAQGWFGDGLLHATGTARQYDSRISATGGVSGVGTFGGTSMRFAASDASGTMTFTPSTPVDTLQIYAYKAGGLGSMSYAIDGGTAVPFSLSLTPAGLYQSAAISLGSVGAHSVSIKNASAADVYLFGLNCYDSTIGGLQFHNAGINGGQTTDFTPTTNPYDALNIGVAFAPKATFIVLGANHWNLGLSVAAYAADLQTLITAYAASGPVVLVSDPPTVSGATALSAQLPYVQTMRNLAASNGVLMFDMWNYFGGASAALGANWIGDGIHPSQQGYGYGTGLLARALAQA